MAATLSVGIAANATILGIRDRARGTSYNLHMDRATSLALAAIDGAVEWVRRRSEAGWPPLSAEYLARVEEVERLPRNQSGADKSWVWEAAVRDRQHFAQVRRQR